MCDEATEPVRPDTWETFAARVLASEFSSGIATHDFEATDGLNVTDGPRHFIEAVHVVGVSYLKVSLPGGAVLSTWPTGSSSASVALPERWDGRLKFEIDSTDTASAVVVQFTRKRGPAARSPGC